ncbi:hypothetical protein HYV10_00415 [Candidatus Dependentiae bacterium]|nr:hypothetical protein [Candidatus Dependentiae bacterium]
MKSIKTLVLAVILGAGIFEQAVQADQITQDKIRKVIQAHQAKLHEVKTSTDLKKFLTPLIKDLKTAVQHAPNTPEYKKLKEALNSMNTDQIVSIISNLKAILNCLDSDIRKTIIDAIPLAFRAILMI